MEPEVVIRAFEGELEIDLCARLMAGSEPWITLQRNYEHCLKAVRNPLREVYLALVAGEFAGIIVLNLRGPFPGYIQTIAVVPERRSQGIGRRLIAFAEERIFRESPNAFLCVSSFNSDAQRFYKRLGYLPIGELTDYFVQGHSEILMRKTLGPLVDFPPDRLAPRS